MLTAPEIRPSRVGGNGGLERLHRAVLVVRADEEVEVLGVADDVRVVQERVRPADEEWNLRLAQDVHRPAIEGVRVEDRVVLGRLAGHEFPSGCG